jgi:hypothetical protein
MADYAGDKIRILDTWLPKNIETKLPLSFLSFSLIGERISNQAIAQMIGDPKKILGTRLRGSEVRLYPRSSNV